MPWRKHIANTYRNASCVIALLQDANVDPLLRQITLGHKPAGSSGALGMTAVYTHSRPETQAREIERALRAWPESLSAAALRAQGSSHVRR